MNKLFITLIALTLFSSCKEEEQTSLSTGNVWIINEGNFGSANATIGVYNTNDTSYQAAQFKDANGFFIGDVLQSVNISNERAYGVLNGSNTVETFDLNNFKSIETLSDGSIDKPRYMAFNEAKDRAYLTIWGPYSPDFSLEESRLLIIDINDMQVIDSVIVPSGVEQIARYENTLLITRNYFGNFNHLTFIDAAELKVLSDIELPAGPDEIIFDNEGNPWVACTSGSLVKIDVKEQNISETIDLNGVILGDVAQFNGEVFFLQADQVKSIQLGTGEVTVRVDQLSIDLPQSLGVNPFNGDIYLGDGVDFGSEGKVLHFNREGELISDFQVGIFPSQFIFN